MMATLRKEMLEQWRTSRFLVLVIVLGAFGMSSPLLAKFMPEIMKSMPGAEQFAVLIPPPTLRDALEQYIKNISQFALLLAIFLAMGMVVQEKERGSAVLMLVKPLSRGAFLLAKFIALAVTFGVALAVSGLLGYIYTMLLFEAPALAPWLGLNALLWLYSLVYVAITLLASTLTRSQAVAAGIGFGALMLMGILSAIPGLDRYLPGQLVAWGAELFYPPVATYWPSVALSLGLIVLCLTVAWLAFRQQEL